MNDAVATIDLSSPYALPRTVVYHFQRKKHTSSTTHPARILHISPPRIAREHWRPSQTSISALPSVARKGNPLRLAYQDRKLQLHEFVNSDQDGTTSKGKLHGACRHYWVAADCSRCSRLHARSSGSRHARVRCGFYLQLPSNMRETSGGHSSVARSFRSVELGHDGTGIS